MRTIKIIKRRDIETAARKSVAAPPPAGEKRKSRRMCENAAGRVKGWVEDFRTRKQQEAEHARRLFFGGRAISESV